MRHRKRNAKLGRNGSHRNAMLANLVGSLIKHKRVTTTLAKAKAARPVAEKLVTLGKSGTLHDRRLAAARLRQQARTLHRRKEDRIAWRQKEDVVRILFDEIAPNFQDRNGGYTRIVKLAKRRRGDAGERAILEWVDQTATTTTTAKPEPTAKSAPAADEPKAEPPAQPDSPEAEKTTSDESAESGAESKPEEK